MTYREMMERDHPELVDDCYEGGVRGCPGDYYVGALREEDERCVLNTTTAGKGCGACWDREAEDTKKR